MTKLLLMQNLDHRLEQKLCKYMCDMGYGLTVEDVRIKAYQMAQISGRPHPFHDGRAGRDWYEGFFGGFHKLH